MRHIDEKKLGYFFRQKNHYATLTASSWEGVTKAGLAGAAGPALFLDIISHQAHKPILKFLPYNTPLMPEEASHGEAHGRCGEFSPPLCAGTTDPVITI
jgi:hypothetical protein